MSAHALDTLRSLPDGPNTPHVVRLKAAIAVLERPQFPGQGWSLPERVESLQEQKLMEGLAEMKAYDRVLQAEENRDVANKFSIRVGGIDARARDEAIAAPHGLAGHETTGPGGWAMALRIIPVTLAQARLESKAPDAWFVTFTNPAGLTTQAHPRTPLRDRQNATCWLSCSIRSATALNEPRAEIECDFSGPQSSPVGTPRHVSRRGGAFIGLIAASCRPPYL